MSYNLKNKSIVMIAVMFAAMVAFSQSGYAQLDAEPVENKAAQDNQPQEQSDDLFGLMKLKTAIPMPTRPMWQMLMRQAFKA